MKFTIQVIIKKSIAIFGIILTIFSCVIMPSMGMGKALSLLGMISVTYPIIKSIKTTDYHLSVLFVFMFSYMFVAFNYFWLGKHVNYNYYQCETLSTVYTVLQILCFFHFVLLLKVKYSPPQASKIILTQGSNHTLFLMLVVLSVLMVTFGQSGSSIFASGGYAETNSDASVSTMFAYSVIPISLSLLYAGNAKERRIVYFVAFYFVLKNLAFGGRIDSVQLLITLFLIRFQYIWSKRKLFTLLGVGATFMAVWGVFRADVTIDRLELLTTALKEFFSTDSSIDVQIGNAPEVYYSSVRIIYFIEQDILNLSLRFQALISFFLSVIVPRSMLPDVADLSSYLQDTYYSGGGGLAPVYIYTFAGWTGVVLFSLFIPHCINLFISNKSSKYLRYYVILLLATTPRWYAYYPIQIIKFCVVGALFYFLLNQLEKRHPAKKNKNEEVEYLEKE